MNRHRVRLSDGLEVYAEERGAGAPVVLLHGFSGSIEAWGENVLNALARRFRAIAVDLPGHGRSGAPSDPARYALPRLIEDLSRVLDELGAPKAHWVGYSMGGRVALGAAVLAPDRVDRLVLEGASPGLATEDERRARRAQDEALAARIERDGIEAFVDAWAALPIFDSQSRLPSEVREAQRLRRLRNAPHALAGSLRGLGTGAQPSFWDRLGDVTARVLLITGEEDRKFTDIAEELVKSLPNARAVTVPGAGHNVHLEAPERWLEAVDAWLS